MKSISNFGKTIALPASLMLAAFLPAQAQNPVESTHIDKKYAYTTVVYKSVAASDKDVLSALESDFSIGDVVRVTLAPPPNENLTAVSASEPVYADKSKGEDAWLQNSAPRAEFSNIASQAPKTVSGTIPVAPKPIPNPMSNLAPNQLPKTVAATPQKQSAVVAPKVAETQKSAPEQIAPDQQEKQVKKEKSNQEKSAKAHKSAKKSGKKSGSKVKLKNRKRGKQRYACPTF